MSATDRIVPVVGVHPDVPEHVYHGQWDAVSNSMLTRLFRTPAHLRAYLDQPQEDTTVLMVGRAAHASILQPHAFEGSFTIAAQCTAFKKSDGKPCTNSGVLEHPELGWLCGVHLKGVPGFDAPTRTVLSSDDHAVCLGVRDAVYAHPRANTLLTSGGQAELSLVWDDAHTGVRCRSRLDFHAPLIAGGDEPTIVDVKTTRDASPRAFSKAISEHGYHRQAAMYLDGCAAVGLAAKHFVFIAVEKEPPFAVGVYRLMDDAIEFGRAQLRYLLARYLQCRETDEWPGYSDNIEDITLPSWAWKIDDTNLNAQLTEVA